MANGIRTEEATRDLCHTRTPDGAAYEYWLDANHNLVAAFFDSAGRIVGTQSVTITVGEFKRAEA